MYIDGSFVTSKEQPNDFDGCWEGAGMDLRALDPVLLTFSNQRAAQKANYGGELFPAEATADPFGTRFLPFFQRDTVTGRPKGVVALDLWRHTMIIIMNEQQYRITQEEAEKFEQALASEDKTATHLDPLLRKAIREGAESLLHDLREEMAAYDALRSGRMRQLELGSLRDVPEALIRARVAAGLTQKSLAERLGLKQQQVQRYEATRYAGVSLERLQSVADALGVQTQGRMLLTVVSAAGDKRRTGPAPA